MAVLVKPGLGMIVSSRLVDTERLYGFLSLFRIQRHLINSKESSRNSRSLHGGRETWGCKDSEAEH